MQNNIEELARLLRYFSLVSTTEAGSGHPTSCLSAADLMAVLMFGGYFKYDLENPGYFNNDRLIFSKGHASPLFYSLYAAAGKVSVQELMTLRKFGSHLEGHPTMEFPYTEVPTGSLGQGLSVGVGMALNAKLDKLSHKTFVLLGDSEMAEGSVWEAMDSAAHYKLNNLVAILDCNRLGQRGETMFEHSTEIYEAKARSFGWETMTVNGHYIKEIVDAFRWACEENEDGKFLISNSQFLNKSQTQNPKPKIIIAKTLKGKGVSFVEDKDGWHGKTLNKEELGKALEELGEVDKSLVGEVAKPEKVELPISNSQFSNNIQITNYQTDKPVATRKAYGNALAALVKANSNVVALDAETSNSTYAEFVKKENPEKFFEMYIAEQNMVGTALGFSRRGKIPFVSTFAAFFTRAFDQIRMSQYANSNIKFIGSHAGVSIGEDGASQMGLEEIAMFRTLLGSVVLYPSDAVSTEKLVVEAAKHFGNVYIQTTRKETDILYAPQPNPPLEGEGRGGVVHNFKIGGSCTLKSSEKDVATVIGAGVTLYEALKAYEALQKEGINIRVIDLYSVKPLDVETLKKAAEETRNIITVEDHYAEGGIAEAVASSLFSSPLRGEGGVRVISLAVRKMPRSGKPEELLVYEEIDSVAIISKIKQLI